MRRAVDPAALLLPERRERVDRVVAGRTRSLVVVLEEVHDPHNIGAIVRTCDCFGLQELHVVEGPRSPYRPAPLVTQGSEKWVDVRRSKDVRATLEELRGRGFTVLASRFEGEPRALHQLPADGKLALVFGNEHHGVSAAAVAAADGSFVVPMFGFTQSLNVSVAVGVTVSWLVLSRAVAHGTPGDLPGPEAEALRERFYVRAVKQRGRIFGGKSHPPISRRFLDPEEDT